MLTNLKAEARADAAGSATADDKLDMLLKGLTSINARLDSDETARKDSDSKLMEKLDSMSKRLDACESDMKARKDADEQEAKAKADAEEKERKEKEEKERADAEEKAREEKERADAAGRAAPPDVQAQLAAIAKRLPVELSAEDRKLMVGAQQRADRIAQAFADDAGAPRWLNGETYDDYRRRLAGKYKAHSKAWKDVDLAPFSGAALDTVEAQIYADAMEAATSPASVVAGTLRESVTTDVTGRPTIRFFGDPEACWGTFKQPRRAVMGMNTQPHRN